MSPLPRKVIAKFQHHDTTVSVESDGLFYDLFMQGHFVEKLGHVSVLQRHAAAAKGNWIFRNWLRGNRTDMGELFVAIFDRPNRLEFDTKIWTEKDNGELKDIYLRKFVKK